MVFARELLKAEKISALLLCTLMALIANPVCGADDEEEAETTPAVTTPSETSPSETSPSSGSLAPVAPPASAGEQKPKAETANPGVSVGGETLDQLLSSAREFVRREKYKQAKEPFKKALGLAPDNQQILAEYYLVCLKLQDWSDASSSLEKVFSLNAAKEKELYVDYAQTLWQLRKYDKAKLACKKALTFGKDKDRIYRILIKIALFEKELVLAEEYYQDFFKVAPKEGVVRLEYGKWLQGKGKPKEAIPHYKIASECRPADTNLHETLAYLLLAEKDFGGAAQEYQRAMAANPKLAGKYQASMKYALQQQRAAQKK